MPPTPESDSWWLPPPHLMPTEAKDFGYVNMNFVGDPLVDPKKRPKWHQYGGHYRPVRPGIPWMPSPEITSPLPLPKIRLPSEIVVGTSDKSMETDSSGLCMVEADVPRIRDQGYGCSKNKKGDESDLFLSSRSSSNRSRSPSGFSSSDEDDGSIISSSSPGHSGKILSVVGRGGKSSQVGFDRRRFGGRPLHLDEDSSLPTGSCSRTEDSFTISNTAQGSGWVGTFRTIRKRIMAGLQRVERSTSKKGSYGAPIRHRAAGVIDAASAQHNNTSPSCLPPGTLVASQRYSSTISLLDTLPLHVPTSAIPESDSKQSRHDPEEQTLEQSKPHSLLTFQEETQEEVPVKRAFDLISLPPDSLVETVEENQPSRITGVFFADLATVQAQENMVQCPNPGHDSLGLLHEDAAPAPAGDTLGTQLRLQLPLSGVEEGRDPPRMAVIDLPLLDAASSGLEELDGEGSSAWLGTLTGLSDLQASESGGTPSIGLSVTLSPFLDPSQPVNDEDLYGDNHAIPSGPSSSSFGSSVWYFRPPMGPDRTEASDPLHWLVRSGAESSFETAPQPAIESSAGSEENLLSSITISSSDTGDLEGATRLEQGCVSATRLPVDRKDQPWPENARPTEGQSPFRYDLPDCDAPSMEGPTYCDRSNTYASYENYAKVSASPRYAVDLVFEASTTLVSSLKEDGGERAFVERVRRKQVEARDNQRIKLARQEAKEVAPEHKRRSKRLGLPGTQDWRRYVFSTPAAYAPLRLREYLSFSQAMLQLEYYPAHHLETIALANWYHRVGQEQGEGDEGTRTRAALPSPAPPHGAESDTDPANQRLRAGTARYASSSTNESRMVLANIESATKTNGQYTLSPPRLPLDSDPQSPIPPRVRFEIDEELFIPPPLTPEAIKPLKLYPDPPEEQLHSCDLFDPSSTWTAHFQATWAIPERRQQLDVVPAAPPPDVTQTGWPTLEQLQDEAAKIKKHRRSHYEVPEQITNTALLMWYPPDLRDGQGPVFEVVPAEAADATRDGRVSEGTSYGVQAESAVPSSSDHLIPMDARIPRASTSMYPNLDTIMDDELEQELCITSGAPLLFPNMVLIQEQAPTLRTVELPPDDPPHPIDTIRLRRELKYRELPPANLPLPKIVCPHEWKAYGYFARPVIENVDMYNTPSPWRGHCNLDPENPRDPYAPIKDVEATFWLDTDTTPEEMLFHLKDHPEDKPLPERWQVGVVHASLPPKPPRWTTPEPDAPDASPFEVQLNPYLEHLHSGAQRMSWDIRYDSLMTYLGFQKYQGLLPLRPQDLAQPASFPFLKQMTINAVGDEHEARLPWPVVVENPEGIKVRDVIFAIFRGFQKHVSQGEYSTLPDWRRRECAHWRERRCAPLSSESWARGCPETGTPEDGLRRIDWLGSRTVFQGLSPDETGWVLFLSQRDSF